MLWYFLIWKTRKPTVICASVLISRRTGRYPDAITNNYSPSHVFSSFYESVHVCECGHVCVWLASVLLISHQSSWCQTDCQSGNKQKATTSNGPSLVCKLGVHCAPRSKQSTNDQDRADPEQKKSWWRVREASTLCKVVMVAPWVKKNKIHLVVCAF